MKKLVILGYFVLSILATTTVVVGSQLAKMDAVDVIMRTDRTYLSDYEVEQMNSSNEWHRKFTLKEGRDFVLAVDLKETRTRSFPFWTTKVDTLSMYVLTEEDKR